MQRTEQDAITKKRKPRSRNFPPADAEFLNDQQAAVVLGIGLSKLFELQRDDPAFPRPIFFGTRSKRHVRSDLVAYALTKRRPAGEQQAD